MPIVPHDPKTHPVASTNDRTPARSWPRPILLQNQTPFEVTERMQPGHLDANCTYNNGSTSLIFGHLGGASRLRPRIQALVSDWKNDYLEICHSCSVRNACGGVFTTSGNRLSQHLRPLP